MTWHPSLSELLAFKWDGNVSVWGPMAGVPFMGPRLGLAGFYSLSSLIPTASVMRWGGFLREKTETVGRATGLRRGGGRELHLVGLPSELRGLEQLPQTLPARFSAAVTQPLRCPRPSLGTPASALCPLALAASSGSIWGVALATRYGWQEGAEMGSGTGREGSSVSQEWGPGRQQP